MRHVLAGKDTFAFLDSRAAVCLQEARKAYGQAGLENLPGRGHRKHRVMVHLAGKRYL